MIRTQTRTSSIYSADDPLALAIKPPPSESDIERQQRIAKELEAKLVSDRIDEELRLERETKKKQNMQVKVCISCLVTNYIFAFSPWSISGISGDALLVEYDATLPTSNVE